MEEGSDKVGMCGYKLTYPFYIIVLLEVVNLCCSDPDSWFKVCITKDILSM